MAKDGLFVSCRKNVRIRDDKTGEVLELPVGFIGAVPAWVEKNWFFKALCKDGTITSIVSTKDSAVAQAEAEAKAKEEATRVQKEKEGKINAAKISATASAQKEAAEKGLDKTATTELVDAKVAEAIKLVEDEYAGK